MPPRIAVPHKAIADFCKKNHIRKLSFFGSVLSDSFGPESDIDVLVEFEPGFTPGFRFFGMQEELSMVLGRKVDLQTPSFLSDYFRKQVVEEAELEYAS